MFKVLWLCSWYPNPQNPFDGDFVQRHAQAASLHHKIHVIKLTPNSKISAVTNTINSSDRYPNLTEELIDYPKQHSLFGKLQSYYLWYRLYEKAIRCYIQQNGLPHLIHVHIPFKSGLMGLWAKRKFNIPFVVTEHWGGYNNVVANNFFQRPRWFRNIILKTLDGALALHSVSNYLALKLRGILPHIQYWVIPNVVNTDLFYYDQNKTLGSKFSFVHISNGVAVKNLQGIIDAFLSITPEACTLRVIGLPADENSKLQEQYPQINFTGEIQYAQVAKELQDADCLLLFSNIENSPCVIGEALCCGVPIIATNVGGIPELLNKTNSILVDVGDTKSLATAMHLMVQERVTYNPAEISKAATNRFSYKAIGYLFHQWYQQVLGKSS